MRKKILFIFLYFFLALSNACSQEITPLEPIQKSDRILILAPHPDDESIGCAGVIQEAIRVGADIHVAYLTNGDHNELSFIVHEKRITLVKSDFVHMGKERKKEAIKAMKLLGLKETDLVFLGYPDFGTFAIFTNYWQAGRPYKDFLTQIDKVPYQDNQSFGAPYIGENILADLETVIKKYRPNKIFVSHPADVNVDHKALYLYLQIALADLAEELPSPKIYPYLIHWPGWPLPRRYHSELFLSPPKQFLDSQIKWQSYKLGSYKLSRKYWAILCYRSQTQASAFYLFSFARKNELFGQYPEINLISPGDSAEEKMISFNNNLLAFVSSNILAPKQTVLQKEELSSPNKGNGEVSYQLKDDALFIRVNKDRELTRRFILMAYLFGYSRQKPFGQMPKIRLIIKHKTARLFDGRNPLSASGIELELDPEELTLKVPLSILGNPDFILASLKTYNGDTSVDATAFRKIKVKGD